MNSSRINKNLLGAIVSLSFLFYAPALAQDSQKEEDLQNPFGVLEFLHWNDPWNNHKYPSHRSLKKSISLMKKAGAGFIRQDFLWQDIEGRPGEFDFRKYDQLVELLAKNNIRILGILHYSTDWAGSCAEWNCAPKDRKLFVNYACRVIERYKDKIKYWEIWNEPDSPIYWKPQDGLKSYCELLKEVYIAAKKIDPDCKILNGGLSAGLASVNKLYDNGAGDYFDILNIHIFENPLNPHSIKGVTAYPRLAHKVMSRNGDAHKKIWITEIGCPGVKRGLKVNNWWMGKNPNEYEQAGWVRLICSQLLKDENVEKIFWAFFRDCKDHWDSGIDYFGLLRWNYSVKPSFKAFKACVNNWKKSSKK
ncbi:MAG: beta-galactosidase [Candidatus Omnitrophota bacterium]